MSPHCDEVRLSKTRVSPRDTIDVTISLANAGSYDDDEVVQVYAHRSGAEPQNPIKSLCGFVRSHLTKRETKVVKIPLSAGRLAAFDKKKKGMVVQPGEYEIEIGASSSDFRMKKVFLVTR